MSLLPFVGYRNYSFKTRCKQLSAFFTFFYVFRTGEQLSRQVKACLMRFLVTRASDSGGTVTRKVSNIAVDWVHLYALAPACNSKKKRFENSYHNVYDSQGSADALNKM